MQTGDAPIPESGEEKSKKTIIKSVSHYIKHKYEKIGRKFKSFNRQEQYDYFDNMINKLQKKVDPQVTDEKWVTGVIQACLKLFLSEPSSLTTVEHTLKESIEQELDLDDFESADKAFNIYC